MMQLEMQEKFIRLVRQIVCENQLPDVKSICDDGQLFALANQHDMAHIIGYAIEKQGIQSNNVFTIRFREKYFQSIQRVAILEDEIRRIRQLFNEFKIDFILLKGATMRHMYPKPWMRVSADIDILVRNENTDEAVQLLVNNLLYSYVRTGDHEVQLVAPNGFHLELHYRLSEYEGPERKILDDVWNRCKPKAKFESEYCLDEDFLFFYHIFHMRVHFQYGGCGVRPLLDIWMLNHNLIFDEQKRSQLLDEGKMALFANTMEGIADKWFSGKSTKDTKDVEQYILSGGAYGGAQRLAAVQAQRGGRKAFILSRTFPPYSSIKRGYPVLNKLPILLPICWVHRLIKAVFTGKTKIAKYELGKSREDESKSTEIMGIFKKLGLI